MTIVHSLLLFLHLLAMAGIIAGWLMQVMSDSTKSPKVLLHSALTQLVIGLLLVGVLEMGDDPVNHAKVAVKLVIALAVVVFGVLNLRKVENRYALIAGLLTIVNVAVAVFW
ncbi:hypothetical protein CLV63_12259 [Murinocardiopsis flavida]|uniref:Integral membrane protein n=1 Tax=Murinocardiopsis flavida TaxID=645275 RepID=A0A2P8CZX5_9ACTN|nr:hypothetical protein [Murinocardiopsis flavida]PSK90525.1 hypothetical protein CLV63_12259 [Murinocardiopsis flavida]